MKSYLLVLAPVLALLGLTPFVRSMVEETTAASTEQVSTVRIDDPADLKPTTSQEHVEQLVAQLLTRYHFRKVRLNDSLSNVVWDNYLKEVDGNRAYLLASDVAQFDKYRNQIDDALVNGDLTAPFDMYNLFRKRYQERSTFIKQTLDKPFDFSTDETFNTDREKLPWAKSTEELNDVWRKVLKNQALELKLAGKADTAIASTLKTRYKNLDRIYGRIKSEEVFQVYMNAFSEALDPHTNYLSPRRADLFNQEMSQSLEGIGALLQEDGEYIKISEVLPGGPAMKSKQFTKGDKILGVAQGEAGQMVSIVGYQVDDAVKLIKGPKGTTVRLQVRPATALASDAPREIKLVREKIKLEEQRAHKEILNIKEGGRDFKLGVVNIPIFYRDFEGQRLRESGASSTTDDVKRLIDTLKQQRVDGIVIDLRGNGGGSLIEAVNLTGLFIPRGPVVQVRESTGETETYADNDPNVTYTGPMAVLVDRFSASASEIFAAALQDYKRGVIVGGQTYGKGTVQQLVDLNRWLKEPDKVGQVKLTTQKFYRINGSSTQHRGVTPDIELPSAYTADEYGESSQPSALPWDQIPATQYTTSRQVDDKLVARLRDKFETRLKSDPELKKIVAEIADYRKAKENTVVSLQEAKRKKERDESEKKRAALNKLAADESDDDAATDGTAPATAAKPAKKKKDLYLTETGRILADMIAFQNRSQ